MASIHYVFWNEVCSKMNRSHTRLHNVYWYFLMMLLPEKELNLLIKWRTVKILPFWQQPARFCFRNTSAVAGPMPGTSSTGPSKLNLWFSSAQSRMKAAIVSAVARVLLPYVSTMLAETVSPVISFASQYVQKTTLAR